MTVFPKLLFFPPEETLLNRGAAVVTGWGYMKMKPKPYDRVPSSREDDLHQLTVGLRHSGECEESLVGEPAEGWFDETITCAGHLDSHVVSYPGDPGGPLIKYAGGDNGRRWTVIGLNNWISCCTLESELYFFTNVPRLMPWIDENIYRTTS